MLTYSGVGTPTENETCNDILFQSGSEFMVTHREEHKKQTHIYVR